MTDINLSSAQQRRAIRAIRHRFGDSTMPWEFAKITFAPGFEGWRIIDMESGSWLEFYFKTVCRISGGIRTERLKVRHNYDAPCDLAYYGNESLPLPRLQEELHRRQRALKVAS